MDTILYWQILMRKKFDRNKLQCYTKTFFLPKICQINIVGSEPYIDGMCRQWNGNAAFFEFLEKNTPIIL